MKHFIEKQPKDGVHFGRDKLSNERIFNLIDSLENLLAQPANRNFQKWNILSTYIWPNSFVGGTYKSEIDYLKDWMERRLIWLDENIDRIGKRPYDSAEYFDPYAYPNPFQNEINFQYYVGKSERVEIEILNSVGQLIASLQDFQHLDGENSVQYLTNGLSNGIYFYVIRINSKKIVNGKLVKN